MKHTYEMPDIFFIPAQCQGLICSSIYDLTTAEDWPDIFANE